MENFPTSPKVQLSFGKEIEFRTLISKFENGAEQRRAKWSQGKRHFILTFNALTQTDIDILWNFYLARKGSFESFNYIDPITTNSYVVRFIDDKLSFEAFGYKLRRTGLNIIQVL